MKKSPPPRGLPGRVLIATLAVFAWHLTPSLSAQTHPINGRLWDIELSVPPGAYRAARPIEVKGDFTPKIERGAFIEGVTFATRGGVQHWKIEGAQLRKVHITGKRNSSVRAVDSVLEDCGFSKDDNWYNFWWSTRSKFENCIFTKRFIRGDLPPLDYAAYAIRSTFYGIDLPRVGMKENPAGYLQKENMGFVNCRFVQCDVPESFLAATVDCVFENCRFQAKRHNWPKETTPIKVTAYYAKQGSPPKSFINGPLTVEFIEAPRTVEFGSSLPHTQSAGRVTLASMREPGQFTMLGSVSKAASEIPISGIAPTSLPTNPPLPQSAPPRASTAVMPAAVDLYSLADVLRPLPSGIELLSSGQLSVPGVEAANAWLAKNLPGKVASMRLFLEESKATTDDGYAFRATSRSQPVTVRGATIQANLIALFKAEDAAALASATKGREIAVKGVVKRAALEGKGRSIILNVTLADAQLQ